MRPTITAFEASPDAGQGLARDLRVLSVAAMKDKAHPASRRAFAAQRKAFEGQQRKGDDR